MDRSEEESRREEGGRCDCPSPIEPIFKGIFVELGSGIKSTFPLKAVLKGTCVEMGFEIEENDEKFHDQTNVHNYRLKVHMYKCILSHG